MNRAIFSAIVLAALLAGVGAALLLTRGGGAPSALERATWFETPRPVPAVALVDHAGRPYGPERLRGRWSYLFFGFTHCPDVCPVTLATLAEARRSLGDLAPDAQPRVVFASVDPARDTPEALARYVQHFDPSFTGVTGNADAVESLTRALGVVAILGTPDDHGGYSVDHSAAVFLVDPDARIVAVSSAPHDAGVLARDYRRIVEAARAGAGA